MNHNKWYQIKQVQGMCSCSSQMSACKAWEICIKCWKIGWFSRDPIRCHYGHVMDSKGWLGLINRKPGVPLFQGWKVLSLSQSWRRWRQYSSWRGISLVLMRLGSHKRSQYMDLATMNHGSERFPKLQCSNIVLGPQVTSYLPPWYEVEGVTLGRLHTDEGWGKSGHQPQLWGWSHIRTPFFWSSGVVW